GLVVVVLHVLIVEPILASVSRFHCRILRVSRLRPSQTGLALHLTKRRRFGGHIGERMPPDQGAERCSAHESPSEHPEPCRWNVDEHDFHRCALLIIVGRDVHHSAKNTARLTRYCHYEIIFAGFDDPAAIHIQLTDKDVAMSRIESKLLEPLSVNVKKGATGRQRT